MNSMPRRKKSNVTNMDNPSFIEEYLSQKCQKDMYFIKIYPNMTIYYLNQ